MLITGTDRPVFEFDGLTVTGLAAPSRGARETSVWLLRLPPGTEGTAHRVDREEIFIALAGDATVTIGEEAHTLSAGAAIIVPPHTDFSVANPGADPFEAVCVLPIGGRAAYPGGEPFTPPWAE
jgi:mannose-6-phosphate isomerase-like protein (cupin superfamily)